MTLKQLLTFFENYYGEKYTGVVLDAVAAYLDGYSAEFYKAAAEILPKRFSRVWNKAPCPAEFEKYMDEILCIMPKPEALPEPLPERDEEACEKFIREAREIFKGKNRGPMADVLEETLESMRGKA